MNFTFWVTDNCNLSCRYCYVDRLSDRSDSMTVETAEAAIKYTVSHFEKYKNANDSLMIGFHGGEPLLRFDLIRYIVAQYEKIAQAKGFHITYTLTTNGTLIDPDVTTFLNQHKVAVTISIDGTPETHDLQRPFKNGKNSHELVIKNVIAMLDHDPYLRIRMTLTPDTIDKLHEDIMYLLDRGCKVIVPALDYYDPDWTENNMNVMEGQLKKVIQQTRDREDLLIAMLNEDFRPKDKCTVGINTLHISPAGDLYPCVLAVGDRSFLIGDIYQGIDQANRDLIINMSDKENDICLGCRLYGSCEGVRCKIVNKIYTGDYCKPCGTQCAVENIKWAIKKSALAASVLHT